MRHALATIAIALLLLLPGCGGDTRQSLTDEMMTNLRELVTTFDGVKDEASAKSAKPRLKSLMEKMNDINERQAKLPPPTEDEIKAIDQKHGKEMEELQMKMAGHMMRVAFDPKISAELQELEAEMKKGKG
jgi:hypothetical protein